jgi:hypothetical protein
MAQAAAAQAGGWSDFLNAVEPGKRFELSIVAMAFAMGFLLGLVGIVSNVIGSIHRRRAEMDLKREMIERGMTADDITKIIEAAAPPEDATQRWIASWAKSKRPSCR